MSIALVNTERETPVVPSPSPTAKGGRQQAGPPSQEVEASRWVPRIRRRVLIAEDDVSLRRSLNDLLSAEGYVVMEAEDGQEALALLAGSPVDVLLLDLAMPRVDGMELLRRIDPPPPVVIIYSAFSYYQPEEVEREVSAKVFRALRKPVPPRELIDAVAASIEELDSPD
jgi:CheY-like chemotaxis protein